MKEQQRIEDEQKKENQRNDLRAEIKKLPVRKWNESHVQIFLEDNHIKLEDRKLLHDVDGYALSLMQENHFEKLGVSIPNTLKIIDLIQGLSLGISN